MTDFARRYNESYARLQAASEAPCSNQKERETHDRLASYDRLHQEESHTLMCACQQVFGSKLCTCGTSLKESGPT